MPIALNPIVSRCGNVAAMLSWLATPRVPFAFITTTRQSPLRTFQVSVCSPEPLVWATQKRWAAGSVLGAPPGWTRKSESCAPRFPACAWATWARYLFAASAGAIPTKTRPLASDWMRMLPSSSRATHHSAALPR